ncbi:Putative acyl-CoA dehydrogenase YdbM [Pseudoclavibacter triregionum]|nr:Putative acyl-CoA dehydrogenase YdbM [Pseudoclavibacter triregionum]
MSADPLDLLPDDLLEAMRERADRVDAENVFPVDDLDALREIGYLKLLVPREMGGLGWTLEQACRAQRRLAQAAPATALAVNMHLIWSGMARVLRERGDHSLDRVLEEIAAGHIYALGISEPGNDAVLFDSTVRAEPDGEGGYRYSGMKIFTSLSPVWTRLGIFGKDESGEEPRLVHGILERGDEGITIHDDWDTVGMRGTQSHSTSFDRAHVPAERIVASLPVGPNAEPFVFAVFANFLLLVGACYLGIGERAIMLAVEAAQHRTSRSQGGRPLADDLQIRDLVAEMGMRQLAARTMLEAVARDVDEQAQHGSGWFPRLTGAKVQATRAARRTVEDALEVVGGAAFRTGHELGRLYRDVAASVFHPSQERSVRQTYANWILGPIGATAGADE